MAQATYTVCAFIYKSIKSDIKSSMIMRVVMLEKFFIEIIIAMTIFMVMTILGKEKK